MDNSGKKPIWTVQPPKGLIKGDYYRLEERFPPYYKGVEGEFPSDPGHLGIVEAIKNDGKIILPQSLFLWDLGFLTTSARLKSKSLRKK